MKLSINIILIISLLSTISVISSQDCPSDGNDCTTESFIYGGCFSIYNAWIDCESTNSYKQCVANCKLSTSYSPCSSVSCNYETMECEYGRHWSGCDDNNKCTVDSCTTTGCVSAPINCTDGLTNTIDNCLPTFGCYYTVNPASNNQQTCTTNANCNDNLPCTTDTCVSGKCQFNINCGSGALCNKNGYCQNIPTQTN